MTYQTVQVGLVGGSNQNRSKAFNSERTLGLYPEPSTTGAYPSVLLPWPGAVAFSDNTGSGTARGMYCTAQGVLYKAAGSSLYKVASNGTETLIGTIGGSGYVSMADVASDLLIATNLTAYVYDGAALTEVTDTDYEAGGTVAALNNQSIWQGLNQRFNVSNAGTPSDISSLNYATAEASGDDLVRVYVFRETLYLMGQGTVEPWYNSGVGSPPFDRIQSGKMDVGLISPEAVGNNDRLVYWLGDDAQLYRTSAYDPQPVMTPSIHRLFQSYNLTGSRVRCIKYDGQEFVLILTSSASWMYSETSGAWVELSYGADEAIYLGYDYCYAYNKHLIMSRLDSKIYELSESTYTDNSQTVIRERITAPVTGAQLGKNGARFIVRRIEIIMESGTGSAAELDPQLMLYYSTDYGQSFNEFEWASIGRSGENNVRIEGYLMANCRQIQFKIRMSDPNFLALQSMAVDVRLGGEF